MVYLDYFNYDINHINHITIKIYCKFLSLHECSNLEISQPSACVMTINARVIKDQRSFYGKNKSTYEK